MSEQPPVILEPTGAMKSYMLKPGTEVLQGRFRVLEVLGRGGMGDVYLAEQISLGRKVALKTLREDLSLQPGMTARFKREAMLLSSVDHPSVVRVIDFGQADGAYVLVMEFVEGENLASQVRRGPLEPERVLQVLKDIAEGLAAIHSQGIVHRDLKADNVLITKVTNGERARLLDFGIAKLAESEAPGAQMTQAGLVLGTPEYLSPEQATGGKVDARSDVYAFGILGYRLLAGRHPFDGPGPREFLLQHITTVPPPLETVAPQLASHGALTALVMRCLAKDPMQRPEGGKGLFEALTALGSAPIGAATTPMRGLATPAPTDAQQTGVVAYGPSPVIAPTYPSLAAAPTGHSAVQKLVAAVPSNPRTRMILAAVVLLPLVIFGGVKLASDPTERKAGELLDQNRPTLALELLDASKRSSEPALRLLRAEAFHLQKRHREEWDLVEATPLATLEKMRSSEVAGLMEDFAKGERDEQLRAAISKMPPDGMRKLAKEPHSIATWGAIRYLDIWRLPGVDLAPLYIGSLDATDCDIASVAAKRLGELGDQRAVEPLEKLRASPRKPGFLFITRSCGHDEAGAALQKLNPKEPE